MQRTRAQHRHHVDFLIVRRDEIILGRGARDLTGEALESNMATAWSSSSSSPCRSTPSRRHPGVIEVDITT